MVTKLQIDRLALRLEALVERLRPPESWSHLYITFDETDEELVAKYPELRGPDGKCKPMRTVDFE